MHAHTAPCAQGLFGNRYRRAETKFSGKPLFHPSHSLPPLRRFSKKETSGELYSSQRTSRGRVTWGWIRGVLLPRGSRTPRPAEPSAAPRPATEGEPAPGLQLGVPAAAPGKASHSRGGLHGGLPAAPSAAARASRAGRPPCPQRAPRRRRHPRRGRPRRRYSLPMAAAGTAWRGLRSVPAAPASAPARDALLPAARRRRRGSRGARGPAPPPARFPAVGGP